MTSVQFAALTVLHEKPGIDQATLAQEIAYDRATIGGVVDRLERKGWVLRKVNQDDRRARQVTLTEEGTEMLAVVAPIVATLQADILAQLTLTERTAFIALASKAVAH
jgi:DNA-binding MarR family transcriptional regulator